MIRGIRVRKDYGRILRKNILVFFEFFDVK